MKTYQFEIEKYQYRRHPSTECPLIIFKIDPEHT